MAITKVSPDLLDLDAGITISVADNSDNLTLTSTDADANSGPNLRMYRNSSSPADSDAIGLIDFEGRNDNSQDVVYAAIDTRIVDASDGTEDGRIEVATILGGTAGVSRVLMDATQTVFNDNSKDIDFRVESDNDANAFFVQGSNGHVGIGNASPEGVLHIHGGDSGSSYTADGADKLILEHSDSVAIDIRTPATNQGLIMFSDGTRSQGLIGYNHSDDSLRFSNSGNLERMRIDSSGDVFIGQTSQTGYTFAQKLVVGDGDANDGITIQSGSTHQGNLAFNHSDGTTAHGRISYQHSSNYMTFFINNSEKVRIDSDGRVGINETSTGNARLTLQETSTGSSALYALNNAASVSSSTSSLIHCQFNGDASVGTGTPFIKFANQNDFIGSITGAPSNVAYNTSSDRDLKNNIVDASSQLDTIKAIQVREYDWKIDSHHDLGVIAQELYEVIPNVVTKGVESDDNGRSMPWSVDYGRLTPYLVKAIQEQQEQIEQLKAEIQTLKGE